MHWQSLWWIDTPMRMTWPWTCAKWPTRLPVPISPNRWLRRNNTSMNATLWQPRALSGSSCVSDPQHIAGKRLLSQVDQRLTQQEKERKAQELARPAQQAAGEREWDRALALCDEALSLSPANNTLITLRKSVAEGKQTQEKVSQLLAESANARKVGELTRAQARAATAQRLDPHNSQVLALCRLLEQEIEEKRVKEELRKVMSLCQGTSGGRRVRRSVCAAGQSGDACSR